MDDNAPWQRRKLVFTSSMFCAGQYPTARLLKPWLLELLGRIADCPARLRRSLYLGRSAEFGAIGGKMRGEEPTSSQGLLRAETDGFSPRF